MIFKLWNSTKLSHIHFCNTQHVFHFTLLYVVVVKDLERWQNSSSETSGVLTLSDLKKKIQSSSVTSHSAYVATETELVGAKIDGLLPPNFL